MVGLLTNESALVALSTFRSVTADLNETQNRISTGLEVATASDNPAFFLVANQTQGDLTVVTGIQDNLEITIQASATATNGVNTIFDSLQEVSTTAITADNDIALAELQFSLTNTVGFIENIVANTSFNGLNLLAGSGTFTVTTNVTRIGGEFALSTFSLTQQNLDNLDVAGTTILTNALNAGASAGFSAVSSGIAEAAANAIFDNLARAVNTALGSRLDGNGDGTIDLTGATDFANGGDVLTANENAAILNLTAAAAGAGQTLGAAAVGFIGTFEDVAFLASVGIRSVLLDGATTDTAGNPVSVVAFDPTQIGGQSSLEDVLGAAASGVASAAGFAAALGGANAEFASRLSIAGAAFDPAAPVGGTVVVTNASLDEFLFFQNAGFETATLSGGVLTVGNLAAGSDVSILAPAQVDFAGNQLTVSDSAVAGGIQSANAIIQTFVNSPSLLTEFADNSGFSAVLRQIDISAEGGNVESALNLASSLIDRANLAASNLGVLQASLETNQEFLGGLADSLNIGIAALIEADLDEESTTLQAQQVQQQLAVQALQIANAQPQILLSLFG